MRTKFKHFQNFIRNNSFRSSETGTTLTTSIKILKQKIKNKYPLFRLKRLIYLIIEYE